MPLYTNGNQHVVTEHNNMINWFKDNGFKVNMAKCKSLCYLKTASVADIPLKD